MDPRVPGSGSVANQDMVGYGMTGGSQIQMGGGGMMQSTAPTASCNRPVGTG